MDTLLEFYDASEPILNIIGAWMLKPKNVVFFYYGLEAPEKERKTLMKALREMDLRCSVRMELLNSLDDDSLLRWIEANRDKLGDFALELSGGDDVMLFMAGRCFERFHCPVYARRPGGRYYALDADRIVSGAAAQFPIEQRLLLHHGRIGRFGRLKPGDLTAQLQTMAVQAVELQKKHPYLWTKQTLCIQQAVAQMEEEGLTLTLTRAQCRRFGFGTKTGHLFRQLEAAGLLKRFGCNEETAELTFASRLVRDCLCDYGVWLEIYLYHVMNAAGVFDDMRLSCIVEWEHEDILNELDVVATAGLGLAVVSCKTCTPDMKALSELCVLAERFGSLYTQPVLAVLPKGSERLENIGARCEEMGIQLLDVRQYSREELIGYFARMGRRMKSSV
ncbi:MAG: DUF1887 family protein [Clostridia bacterium]|nr:DUF1887 family protein [Clostridia bacterium]